MDRNSQLRKTMQSLASLFMLSIFFLPTCTSHSDDSASYLNSVWKIKEDLRLTGTPEQEFGKVGAVVADSDDNIYILDVFAQTIYVFDSVGVFSHTIGSPGEGPGELKGASGLAFEDHETIWVTDDLAGRISVFRRNGVFVRHRMRPWMGAGKPEPYAFQADGGYVDWAIVFPRERETGSIAKVEIHPRLLHPGMQRVDSLPQLEFEQEMARIGGVLRPRVFFSEQLIWTLDGHGHVWFAHSRDYRLYKRRLATGDTVLTAALDEKPAAVTKADREAVRADLVRRGGRYAQDYLRVLPAEKPLILRLFTDGDEYVFAVPETADASGGATMDVFRYDGTYVGRIKLPEPVSVARGAVPSYAVRDYVLLAGEDGTPYVTRLRIRR